ncbi:MAG: glycosyltransferase family 4 protein [Phycisphaerales bacterium]
MRILMFEPDAGGHRLTYLRQLLPALDGLGEVSVVVGEQAIGGEAFRHQLGPLRDKYRFESVNFEPQGGLVGKARARLEALRVAIGATKPEHIFLPSGDGLAQLLGAPGFGGRGVIPSGVECEAGMHRGSFAYTMGSRRSRAQNRLGLWALARSPLARVQFVDVMAYEWLRDHGHALARRASVLADPVDPVEPVEQVEARRRLGIPEDGRLIGTSGHLDARKGVDLLVRAFGGAKLASNDRLLLAGRPSPGITAALNGEFEPLVNSGRVIPLTRYLSDEELSLTLAACDVVCTAHPSHVGLSNICLRAAAAGRPVLSGDYGWFERVVGGFKLGWTCRVTDPGAFSGAIARSLDEAPSFTRGEQAGRLLEFHSQANSRRTFVSHLRARLGLGADLELRTWEWACS